MKVKINSRQLDARIKVLDDIFEKEMHAITYVNILMKQYKQYSLRKLEAMVKEEYAIVKSGLENLRSN